MPGGSAIVDELAAIDLVGSPLRDAICLDAVLLDQLGGVPFDKRRRLAPPISPCREPCQPREK
jgi:hypothetical protein